MCLDETGFKLNMTSVYGWAPKGERAIDSAPGKRGKLITTIGAMSKDGFLCSALGYGGIDKDGFFAFMTTQLFPMLKRGTLILLDNLSAHKDKRVQQVAKKLGLKLIFQPPYSPEFNPIELAWNTIKTEIRSKRPRTFESLLEDFQNTIENIPSEHFNQWFKSCGF